MIKRPLQLPPDHVYPADPWRMVETRFYPRLLERMETLFSTANGYLGMRGGFEEGRPSFRSGTFVNGFYESWPIAYTEEAYGFAKTGQTMVNVTDSKILRLYVDDEPLFLPTANLLRFERVLDMRSGTLDREVLWETPSGKQVAVKSRRLVSFEHRHLAAIRYEVTLLNAAAPVVISSEMLCEQAAQAADSDPRGARAFQDRVLVPKTRQLDERRILLGHATRNSGMTLACGIEHTIETGCSYSFEGRSSEDTGKIVFSIDARPGQPVQLTKYMTYHTSRSAPPEELCERAGRTLDRAVAGGFDDLLGGQRRHLDDFWRRSDVRFDGNPAAQQAIRFNLFQVFQSVARAEGAGIPAKGLTGQGYDGHYFWDTETYILPFLIYTAPRIARNLLKFRHSHLDKARERARQVNQKGALFPWRTINGEEASAYYAAGTAQYHINADIVYALRKYVDATGDTGFLRNEGAEILVETARLWTDLGFFSRHREGRFCIHGVTGPDEYNTVVDNNTYTNLMARENLRYAAATVRSIREHHPERFVSLRHDTDLDPDEIEAWQQAADNMYLPYDERTGINPQDDNFLDKEPWDLENTPADRFPLLLHHHPLVIYRHQVIKQADVVLAMFLCGRDFTAEQKKHNFDYYDPLTTGDSSLSASIQSILAFELGEIEKAQEYIEHALLMDLADVGGNVKDGCHIASMGGTWMAIVNGFAGMRDYDGRLSFRPRLPVREGVRIRFSLTHRGRRIEIDISNSGITYTLRDGEETTFLHDGKEIRLTRDAPSRVVPVAAGSKSGPGRR